MQTRELLMHAHLDAEVLEAWIEAGWLLPASRGGVRRFSEIDLARVQLIQDLKDLGLNDEGIPVVLDLVDKLHGLRRALNGLLLALSAQPQEQRQSIVRQMRRTMTQGALLPGAIPKIGGTAAKGHRANPARGRARRLT